MPSCEGSRIRTQPNDRRRDLLGLAHPSDRLLRDHFVAALSCAAAEAIHHRRLDDAGAHGVHTDVCLGVIESGSLSKTDNAELRGAVRGLSLTALHSGA